MRFFLVEVLAVIGAVFLISLWLALGEYLFHEPTMIKVGFMIAPAVLILGDLIYMTLKSKDD